ncbi:MAG TPA: hypothetical protein VNT52_18795 [Acidimicrobiales bacterium]|jgi:hypothetical protein|nr:hypothetical protein [Acidimicrobiales bacterium]
MSQSRKDRDRLAALRTKHRERGLVVMPGGQRVPVEEAAAAVRQARSYADAVEVEAVVVGRVQGLSWDRISVLMGGVPSGEHLRRKYAEEVRLRSLRAGR